MAESVFDFSCQVPLNVNDTILVINYLKNNSQIMPDLNGPAGSKGYIETHNLFLIMALLYCFDCSYFENRGNSKRNKSILKVIQKPIEKKVYFFFIKKLISTK